MNLIEAFTDYLQTLGIATLGQDLFIGGAPSSNEAPDNLWWILSEGGSPIAKNSTGEVQKQYTVSVYCRNQDYKTIYDAMFALEEDLNCSGCTQLAGFDTDDITVTSFPIDQDLDSEDRKVGLLQATIKTYKECT